MNLPNLPFVILDTETTGFIPKVNRIIEYASVRVDGGEVTDEYEQLISIPGDIPEVVQTLTRIYPGDIEGKPNFDDLRQEICKHIGEDTIIVGQNVGFDIGMLKGEGIDLSDRPWIDTSMLASLVFPEFASYSLGYMSTVLNLNHAPVHRALGDVRATLELLERCWERLLEVPPELQKPLQAIMQKAPDGYRQFFAALPDAQSDSIPTWLVQPPKRSAEEQDLDELDIAVPDTGSIQLVEAPLDSHFLQQVIDAAIADSSHTHWIAVKNLQAAQHSLHLPEEHVRVIHYPSQLLDTSVVNEFANQSTYTADEATLAVKLSWYEPQVNDDAPIHGNERFIWNGKLACTYSADRFAMQFADLPHVVLINHWELLSLLADTEHPGQSALTDNAHIIVDDASMLEDTATKAYAWSCPLNDLRAASEGNEALTKFADLLQIWAERLRQMQDVYYITAGDLTTPEARGMRDQLDELLGADGLTNQAKRLLGNVWDILEPDHIDNRIVYIETRQDGSQYLESAPERIGQLLQKHLYNQHATTLLIPPQSAENLREVVPTDTTTHLVPAAEDTANVPLYFDGDVNVDSILEDPPEGKSVILMSSRGRIEHAYVRFAVHADDTDYTLICQGLNGGMGRMQAEFSAAPNRTVWVLTPWMFEGVDLPPKSIDHMFVESLPFDHPNHTILSKRSEHYRNSFGEYSLPRLMHRLYRLLRTFTRYRTDDSDVCALDARIEQKEYGKQVWRYLKHVAGEAEAVKPPSATKKTASPKPKKPPKKDGDGQLSLFS